MSRRLVEILLRLLPSDFRGDFSGAMLADLEARGALWSEVPGLIAAIVREHGSVLRQDFKHTLRLMSRTPGFTAAAVLMLAVGIGANTTLFAVIDAVLLRSPFAEPHRLVVVGTSTARGEFSAALPLDAYQALARTAGPLESVAILDRADPVLGGVEEPRRLRIECVTASMFDVLKAPPFVGRAFSDVDSGPGAAPVIVLSFNFWQQLGGSRDILGTALRLNDASATVIGVMPKGFGGPHSSRRIDGWAPVSAGGGETPIGCATGPIVDTFARLRPGVALATAEQAIGHLRLSPLADEKRQLQTPFRVLSAAVMCVLLIACANVGGLQLERTLARRREFALRTALGASRGRLIRQSLTENLVLALAGGVVGLAMAVLTLPWLVSLLPDTISHIEDIALNGRTLTITFACAVAAALLSGVFPLLLASRVQPARDLADYSRATRRGGGPRRALAAIELALSVVLLIGAALMIQTFRTLSPSDPGFDYKSKLTTSVQLPASRSASPTVVFDALFDRIGRIDGVRAATGSTYVPMSGTTANLTATLGTGDVTAKAAWVRPNYFSAMKIRVVEGREFSAADAASSAPVTIVNEEMARTLRPDGSVLGATLRVTRRRQPPISRVIVGVIANTRTLGSNLRAWPEVYIPFAQQPGPSLNLFVETDGRRDGAAAAELRTAIRDISAEMVLEPVIPYATAVERTVSYSRLGAWLLGVFAAMAVGLAAVGLMATLGWWVSQRTRELGVRVALGASPIRLVGLVVRQGATLGLIGIGVGCAAAAGLTRYLQGWIYGIKPLDPATFLGCAALMLLVALIALFFPTRRASRVDPVIALRAE